MRVLVIIASLGVLGGAGYGAWTGYGLMGAAAATTQRSSSGAARAGVVGITSIRSGSGRIGGSGGVRVK